MLNKNINHDSFDERNEHYYGYCNVIDSYLKKRGGIDNHFAFLPIDILYTPDITEMVDKITVKEQHNTVLFLQHYLIKILPAIYKNMVENQDITVIIEMQRNSFFCKIESNHPVILHLKKQVNRSNIEIYLDDVFHGSLYKKTELAIKNIMDNSLIKPLEITFYPKYKTDDELQFGYRTLYGRDFFRKKYINPIQNFVGHQDCMIQTLYLLKKWLKNPEMMRVSIQRNHDARYLLDYSTPEIMFRANNIKNMTTYAMMYREESKQKLFKKNVSLDDLITTEYLPSQSILLKKILMPVIKNYILSNKINLLSEIRAKYADKLLTASEDACYLYIEKRLVHGIDNIRKTLKKNVNQEHDDRVLMMTDHLINALSASKRENNYQIPYTIRHEIKKLGVAFSQKPKKNITPKMIEDKINQLKRIKNKYLNRLGLSFELKHLKKIIESSPHIKDDYHSIRRGEIEKNPQYIKFFKKNYAMFYANDSIDKKETLLNKYDIRHILKFKPDDPYHFDHLIQWLIKGGYEDQPLYACTFSYLLNYLPLRSSQIDRIIDTCFQKKFPILILNLFAHQLIEINDFDIIRYERTFIQIMYEKYSECSKMDITLTSLLLWVDQNNLDDFLDYYKKLDASKKEILLDDMLLYLSTVLELDETSSMLFYRIIMVIHYENYIEQCRFTYFLDELLKKCLENHHHFIHSHLYQMIQSDNIAILNLHPIEQTGYNCKITALACLDKFWGNQLKFKSIPVHKNQQSDRRLFLSDQSLSMRYVAKLFDSRQGELLEIKQMTGILDAIGYQSDIVFCNDKYELHQLIQKKILNDEPIIYFIAISPQHAYPLSSYIPSTEHACIISGYHKDMPLIRITYQNKHHWVSIDLLFESNRCLPKCHEKEHYIDIKSINLKRKYELLNFINNAPNDATYRTSITPSPDSGFQGKLIVVKKPELELIKDRRNTLLTRQHRTEATGLLPNTRFIF